jgi:nucleotide-binding universal stress UspA family protein
MGRIIVAVNPANYSAAMITEGVTLAKYMAAPITLLSIIEKKVQLSLPKSGIVLENDYEAEKESVINFLSGIKDQYEIMDIEVIIGIPKRDILKIVSKTNASLLVVGTNGHTGFNHLLLGSTAEYLIRHACINVLVIPFKQQQH